MELKEEYPDFFRLAAGLQSGSIKLEEKQDSGDDFGKQELTEEPLKQSNVVTSRVKGSQPERHQVAIDLDMDAVLIKTSTEGHHHLIVDKQLSWDEYSTLLKALEKAGLIQAGYLKASLNRGATVLRVPWVKKEVKN